MVYGPPTAADEGVKILPLIPVPLNVPPEGLPDSAKASAFTQIVAGKPVKLTLGNAFTVTD